MKILYASKNGQKVHPSEIEVYLDRGRSDLKGVYEAVQTYSSIPFRLDEHMKRLQNSARESDLEIPLGTEKIKDLVLEAITKAGVPNQFLTVIVVPLKLIIASRELDIDLFDMDLAFNVMTLSVERPHPSIKSLTARAVSAHALGKAYSKKFDEVILVDHKKLCTEGAFSNLFWIKDSRLYTNTEQALAGITQEAIMELSRELGGIKTSRLLKNNIYTPDEIFLSSSRLGIMPVVSVDRIKIGQGIPGPVTKKIKNLFLELIKKECSK